MSILNTHIIQLILTMSFENSLSTFDLLVAQDHLYHLVSPGHLPNGLLQTVMTPALHIGNSNIQTRHTIMASITSENENLQKHVILYIFFLINGL